MGFTATQKIISAKTGCSDPAVGDLLESRIDLVMGNDITAPVAISELERANITRLFDREKIALILDHSTPCKDIASARLCKTVRDFAKKYDIPHFYDVGTVGIEHALIPEQGLAAPGELIIGADSHTCTYGALGAFSTGVGSTDMAAAMATGLFWLKVPDAIQVILHGSLPKYVGGKDLILYLIGQIGVDGALYKSLEFAGEGVASLSMDDRFTVCNMVIEAGAKNGIFPVDELTREYLQGRVNRNWTAYSPDSDAEYERRIEINLSELQPMVSLPHLPSNTACVDDASGLPVDQVVIGSCTNGRIKDLREAAELLRGRKVKRGVRCIIIPATEEIYKQAMLEGLIEIFVDAGCAVSTPTCGPCLGGHMGVLADGERCVSTTNRNFVGRMGPVNSEIILASPAVAAASAVTGVLTSPLKL